MSDAPGSLVLVVDDEAPILRVVRAALEARGYQVATAENAETAIHLSATDSPAVIILDLGLPDMDGIEVCRRIRQWSETPIIVLTVEGGENRKVSALDEGADDYVTKPFSMPELLARVRVALRHHRHPAGETSESELEVGDLIVDLARHEVRLAGRAVELTPKEFDFLALLARHPGRVLTHRTILQEVWGPDYGKESQYLRVYASQLRKKLADDPARPRLITEPRVGYRLIDPAETRASGA
jgi:two-component system, OmpR family, KDP operon response regulator KdpE